MLLTDNRSLPLNTGRDRMTQKPTYEELEARIALLEAQARHRANAEDALRRSERHLSQILQCISIPILVIDDNHLVTHYNHAMEALTGVSAKDVIGTNKQWMAFYSKERPVMVDFILDEASEEMIARYYAGKYRKSSVMPGAYEAEDFFPELGKDGRWAFFTGAPLADEEGVIVGAVETLQDVTARKRAEEALRDSERRFRTLLDFAPYPIVTFDLEGAVTYLNPAFTEVFGWTMDDLRGKRIPYVPSDLEQDAREQLKRFMEDQVIHRFETRRLTKDGRVLDVVIRATLFSESGREPTGELVILRDITLEKKIAMHNEAMFRLSMALPEYPDLEDLLDFVSGQVKRLLATEGGVIILFDEEKKEIFFPGAAYDDPTIQRRVKELRFEMIHREQFVAEKVIRTGKPIIVNDTAKIRKSYPMRDRELGYQTRNFLQVPLKSGDRVIGVLTALNKKSGGFDHTDLEMLETIAGTVALSIENARYSEELKKAYREVLSLNQAKDRVFHHLSHELKTPLAILLPSLNTLSKKLTSLPEGTWRPTIERARRNVERLLEIQYQVDDIVMTKPIRNHAVLSLLVDLCADELQALVADETGEGPLVERIRHRIEAFFGPKDEILQCLKLDEFVRKGLDDALNVASGRRLTLERDLQAVPDVLLPPSVLKKVIDGLLKNAIENTPDGGKIEVVVRPDGEGAELVVKDYGVGIREEHQTRIFEGFFSTQETMDYSSGRPYSFNAGGKGADLLRMSVFSERYNFKITMSSQRCAFLRGEGEICPGDTTRCNHASTAEDCRKSGGTTFRVSFPTAHKDLESLKKVVP
jgi:PAS domain S-box-containing protein